MNISLKNGHPIDEWGDNLAEMYVKLILEGRRFFAEVPEEVKEKARQLLIEMGREDLIEEQKRAHF